jgi:subtilase family serine protease
LAACGVTLASTVQAVFAQPQPALIVAPVEDGARVRLVGNVSPHAEPARDAGPTPGTMPINNLSLVLRRTAAQERALGQLLAAQQDPKSASFHHWLTPEQFGNQFGPAESDMRALSAWLRAQGFAVRGATRGRDLLQFSGTAAQVEGAFHTRIHYFVTNSGRHWANVTDPEIPRAFAPVVAGVTGLHDFAPIPQHRKVATPPTQQLRSLFNAGANGNAVGPSDFATIYNVRPIWDKGITGNGVTIAIVAQSDVNPATAPGFWSAFGVAKTQTIKVMVPPGLTDPGETRDDNETEADLDLEVAGGVAQAATLILIPSSNAFNSAQYAIDSNLAPIVSISFGECELALGTAGNAALAALFQQAVAQGMTVAVAAGDQGVAACDGGSATTPAPAVSGLAVNGAASTPYNTAVGGTDFNPVGLNAAQYWSATNSAATFATALSYMPEMPWNSSCANPVLLQVLTAFTTVEAICNDSTYADLVVPEGGGGGFSACTTPSGATPATCAGGYAQPGWQTGVLGIPATGLRALPDVAFFAANGLFGTAWVMCDFVNTTCDPNGSLAAADGYELIGGTSASTPAFAGTIALLLQTQASPANPDGRQGLVNPTLYQLAAAEYGSSQAPNAANLASCNSSAGNAVGNSCIFYDVTLGANAAPCASGSSDCITATGGDAYGILGANGTIEFSAGAGFDPASGLGSLNVGNFIDTLWISPSPTNLSATPGNGSIALRWTASARAQSYDVYQGTAAGGEAATPARTGITAESVTLTGLTNGQTYFYKIAAVNGGGTSVLSGEASATVLPAAPTALTATSGNAMVTLSWGASAGAATYDVYQGPSAGGEAATAVQSGLTGTSTTVSSLSNGQTYFFRVAAVNKGGRSAESNEASATPSAPGGGGGGGAIELWVLFGAGALLVSRVRRRRVLPVAIRERH